MNLLIGILLVLFVLAALLLVLIILAQDDGTEGAGIIFGSAASQQYGARKGNIITKTTGILATIFITVALTLSFLFQFNNKDLDIVGSKVDTTQTTEWWSTDTPETTDTPLESIQTPNSENTNTSNSTTTQSNTQIDSTSTDTSNTQENNSSTSTQTNN